MIEQTILDFIMRIAQLDSVPSKTDQLRLEIGLDSISFFELVMNIESEFNIHLPLDAFSSILTVEDLISYVLKEVTAHKASADSSVKINPPTKL